MRYGRGVQTTRRSQNRLAEATVQSIFTQLAEALNARGVLTAQGRTWTYTAVRRVQMRGAAPSHLLSKARRSFGKRADPVKTFTSRDVERLLRGTGESKIGSLTR